MWIPLIFYKIQGKENIKQDKHYVFCPNHTSFLDIILIYISIPVYFHTMGKAEILKIPLFRRFFKHMNIPVNRQSRKDSHRAFLRAGEDLDKGVSITLFPEGTIHHNYPHVGRFKNGPFKLAIEKQVPIVPITFIDNWLVLPDNYPKNVGHPGVVHVIIHQPVETTGLTENDIDHLKKKVFEIIEMPLRERFPEYFIN
jgi:1-acyl-sn-glycerol-3-phosphate acyltransferase